MRRLVLPLFLCLMFYTGCEEELNFPEKLYPEVVYAVPPGFITLDAAIEGADGLLDYWFRGNQFSILPAEWGLAIFQTHVTDNKFIVTYGDVHYVNERVFSEIVDYAISAKEDSNRVYYAIGDLVKLKGMDGFAIDFELRIISVEEVGTIDVHGVLVINEIKFEIYPYVPVEFLIGVFINVETIANRNTNLFTIVDENTVRIRTRYGDRISAITVSNPSATVFFRGFRRYIRVE